MVVHRQVQRERRVLRDYAFRRQWPMIHTYAIIIAATLNTIRYSISLFHCLTGDETGVSASGTASRLTHPGQGCPQRSQLQPPCASAWRSGNLSNAMFFNISLAVSVSSVNKRVVFIESLLVRPKLRRPLAAAGRLLSFALQNLPGPGRVRARAIHARAESVRGLSPRPGSTNATKTTKGIL